MWEMMGVLLVGTAVSGLVPLVNAELLVAAAAVAAPAGALPLIAVTSAVGQMTSKTSLFALARWAPARLPPKARGVLRQASSRIGKRDGAISSLVFASAATGLPPFYGVSLAMGAIGMRLSSFVVAGTLGRLIRFGVIAWLGHGLGGMA